MQTDSFPALTVSELLREKTRGKNTSPTRNRYEDNVIDIYSHEYMKIKINPDADLPLEKLIAMHNVIILIKSVFNRNDNHYDYKAYLESCSFKQYKNVIL